jgi:hypothetical protein
MRACASGFIRDLAGIDFGEAEVLLAGAATGGGGDQLSSPPLRYQQSGRDRPELSPLDLALRSMSSHVEQLRRAVEEAPCDISAPPAACAPGASIRARARAICYAHSLAAGLTPRVRCVQNLYPSVLWAGAAGAARDLDAASRAHCTASGRCASVSSLNAVVHPDHFGWGVLW